MALKQRGDCIGMEQRQQEASAPHIADISRAQRRHRYHDIAAESLVAADDEGSLTGVAVLGIVERSCSSLLDLNYKAALGKPGHAFGRQWEPAFFSPGACRKTDC